MEEQLQNAPGSVNNFVFSGFSGLMQNTEIMQ